MKFINNGFCLIVSVRYTFILEAPTSIIQRRGDDTLTYLNKGVCVSACALFIDNI